MINKERCVWPSRYCARPLTGGHDRAPGSTSDLGDQRSGVRLDPGTERGQLGERHRALAQERAPRSASRPPLTWL